MKEKLFIVGDVHGEYDMFEQVLSHWNESQEQLILLGDLADRGPKSKKCWLKAKELVEQKSAVCLMGNHEDIFLRWLDDPEENLDWYLRNGGQATLESLLYKGVLEESSPTEIAMQIRSIYADLIKFIQELPLYYETEYCICVHAGLDLDLEDWRQTSRRDFMWLREEFYSRKNPLEQLIVFGHTPVQSLHNHVGQTHIWYFQNKVGIDGGATYNGALHGVVVSKKGIEADYQVIHPNHRWE